MTLAQRYHLLICCLHCLAVTTFVLQKGFVLTHSTERNGICYETESEVSGYHKKLMSNLVGNADIAARIPNKATRSSTGLMSRVNNKNDRYHRWDLDILSQSTSELKDMIHYTFQYYNSTALNELDDIVDQVEKEMKDNPFHNFHHVATVVHASFMMLTNGGADTVLNKQESLILLLSALMHDIGHPGNNNDYEVKIKSKLAEIYDNESVLENYSIERGIEILNSHGKEFLTSNFGTKYHSVFNSLTEAILFTDMSRHGDLTSKLKTFIAERAGNSPAPMDAMERQFVINVLLHAADISNPALYDFQTTRDWGIRIREEFTLQVMKETTNGLTVNPMMTNLDGDEALANFQIGFGNFISTFFKDIGDLLPQLKFLNENITINSERWAASVKP